VLKVSNSQRRCKEETWRPGQVAWPTGLSSGPHAPLATTPPYYPYKYHGAPPNWPVRVWQRFLSSGSVECGSSTRILWILTESRLSSSSGVSGFWHVRIPMTLPRSGWFTNHSKSFIHLSYVICEFTYCIVELVFVLSYIRSRVWGSIKYNRTRCGDYYLIPQRLTPLNVVLEVLS
jgi:hypothetical protein